MKDPSIWVTDPNESSNPEGYDVEKHKAQRAEHGFSTYDWWNFNSYLSFVIVNGLTKFQHDRTGYPGSMTDEEWGVILQEMIDGFEAQEILHNGIGFDHKGGAGYRESYDEWAAPLKAKWKRASVLFIEYYDTLWD